jgi:hypothetical protein
MPLTLLSLLFEERRSRDPKVSCGTMNKTFVPFTSSQFVFESHQHDVAERTLVLSRIAPQALMQSIWHVFYLEICHGMTMACFRHAVKNPKSGTPLPTITRLYT